VCPDLAPGIYEIASSPEHYEALGGLVRTTRSVMRRCAVTTAFMSVSLHCLSPTPSSRRPHDAKRLTCPVRGLEAIPALSLGATHPDAVDVLHGSSSGGSCCNPPMTAMGHHFSRPMPCWAEHIRRK
jgi:hypothetical protein